MLRIGSLSRKTGVSVQAIRYYERFGLLDPARRSPSGYRLYDDDAVRLIEYIRRVQKAGAKLEDIRDHLKHRRTGHDECRRFIEVLRKRRSEYQAQLKGLEDMLRDNGMVLRHMERCLAKQAYPGEKSRFCPVMRKYSRIRVICTSGRLHFPKGLRPFT